MDFECTICLICGLFFGTMLGIIFTILRQSFKNDGHFIVNRLDPNKEVYRLSFNDLEKASKKDRVILKVKHVSDYNYEPGFYSNNDDDENTASK